MNLLLIDVIFFVLKDIDNGLINIIYEIFNGNNIVSLVF